MNKSTITRSRLLLPTIGAVIAAAALAGCQRHDPETAAGTPDTSAAQAERRADAVKPEVRNGAEAVGDRAREVAQEANRDVKQAANTVGDKVADAVITTSVNAELTKDPTLSAMQINVDTSNGNVSLRGTAPSSAARDRAAQLASNVRGVSNVDNQLIVAQR